MNHVFLSYSRKDTAIMQRVRDDLRAAGIDVWTDENLTPGTEDWQDAIEDAIEHCTSLLVLLSPDAKNSPWVRREIRYAKVQRKPVFPTLVRGNDHDAVPFELINAQWVDIRDSNYALGIQTIITAFSNHTKTTTIPQKDKYEALLTANELSKLFAFELDNLVYNRRGKASPKQKKLAQKTIAKDGVYALVFGILALVLTQQTFSPGNSPTTTILFFIAWLVSLIIEFALLGSLLQALFGTCTITTGKLSRKIEDRRGKQYTYLQIGDRTKRISHEQWQNMCDTYQGQ